MTHIFKNAYISVSGHVLNARSITINDGFAEVDVLKMNDGAGNVAAGMPQQSIQASFLQDFAAGSVHEVLSAAKGVAVTVIVKPATGTTSETNPKWTLTGGLVLSYNPMGAQVGQAHEVSVEFKTTGTALVYAIAD